MRKILSLALAILMALTFASIPVSAEPAENVLTIAILSNPNLDVHWNSSMVGFLLISQLREGLYRYTRDGFELAGATDVAVSDDGMVWTFNLREDAKWSDGKPVTAADYVYSMQRLVDPEIGTPYMNDYGCFLKNGPAISAGEMAVGELGVIAVDDFTLEIQLEELCTFFDALLCYSTYIPLRSEFVVEDGNGEWAWDPEKSVTNGAMILTACDPEQEIVLERNPYYWDAASVKTDKIVVKLANDLNTQLSLVRTGDVDMIFDFPSEEAAMLQSEGLYHSNPNLHTYFIMINNHKEPYSNPLVRRAMLFAVNRDYLAKVLFNGTRAPATGMIGPGFPGRTADSDFRAEGGDLFGYDLDYAKELLAEAGYPDGDGFPVLVISYPTDVNHQLACEFLQGEWEKLGITVQLESIEPSAMGGLRNDGKFDVTPQNWFVDYFDVSNMFSIFVTDNFINAGRYNSEKFDGLYYGSMKVLDNAERIDMLHEAENTLILEETGVIPLFHRGAFSIYRDDVCSNVFYNGTNQIILTQVIVTK